MGTFGENVFTPKEEIRGESWELKKICFFLLLFFSVGLIQSSEHLSPPFKYLAYL